MSQKQRASAIIAELDQPVIELGADDFIDEEGVKWSVTDIMRDPNSGPAIVGEAKFKAREAYLKKSNGGKNGPAITVEGFRHPTDPPPCTPEEHQAKLAKARAYLAGIRAQNRPSPVVG